MDNQFEDDLGVANGKFCQMCGEAFGTMLPGRVYPVTEAPWHKDWCIICWMRLMRLKKKLEGGDAE